MPSAAWRAQRCPAQCSRRAACPAHSPCRARLLGGLPTLSVGGRAPPCGAAASQDDACPATCPCLCLWGPLSPSFASFAAAFPSPPCPHPRRTPPVPSQCYPLQCLARPVFSPSFTLSLRPASPAPRRLPRAASAAVGGQAGSPFPARLQPHFAAPVSSGFCPPPSGNVSCALLVQHCCASFQFRQPGARPITAPPLPPSKHV